MKEPPGKRAFDGSVIILDEPAPPSLPFPERLAACSEDPRVRCLVLTDAGAGALGVPEARLLPSFPRPVLFAFRDAVAGPLLAVAAGADIRIGTPGASMEIESPGSGSWLDRRLERLVGSRLPSLRGRRVQAPELLACGLISRLSEDPLAEATRLAGVISSRGPIALELAKEALWRGLEMPLAQALRFETDLTLLLQTTKDRAEGVRAFLEKRAPAFRGD